MRQALVGGVDGGLLAGVVADADGMLLLWCLGKEKKREWEGNCFAELLEPILWDLPMDQKKKKKMRLRSLPYGKREIWRKGLRETGLGLARKGRASEEEGGREFPPVFLLCAAGSP